MQEVRSGQGSLEDVFLTLMEEENERRFRYGSLEGMERDRYGTVCRCHRGAAELRPLILVAVFGIFMPFRMGPERFFSAAGLLLLMFFRPL